jgi:hypothetical protein
MSFRELIGLLDFEYKFRRFLSSLMIMGAALILNSAEVSASGGKKKPAKEWVQPTHIQMSPMMIPVGNQSAPMTFFLEAVKPDRVEEICEHMPRVRDAVLRVFSRSPIPVSKRRKIILKGVERKILKPINKAIGKREVTKIFTKVGVVNFGTAKIKKRPFAIIGNCVDILRSEQEREAAAKAAAEK